MTGKKLANPGNFLVRMGTPMKDLIDACGGMPEGILTVIRIIRGVKLLLGNRT